MEDYKNYLDNGNLPKPNFVKVEEEINLLYETLERIAEISKIQRYLASKAVDIIIGNDIAVDPASSVETFHLRGQHLTIRRLGLHV